MNKEIKLTIFDLCIGYGCVALCTYVIGGLSYAIGKTRGKIEVAEKVQEMIESANK